MTVLNTQNAGVTEYRIAGAPISWGVCEVPGWGYQLGPDRVLTEMREVGLLATELGPEGFLPAARDPRRRAAVGQLPARRGGEGRVQGLTRRSG